MTKLITQLILFSILTLHSQNKIKLKGIVLSNKNPIENAHIYNLTSTKGTTTNSKGEFTITVQEGDKLYFSAMPFNEKQIRITSNILTTNNLIINLSESITTLKAVTIKNHKLTGSLLLDIKKIPEDTNAKYSFKINKKDIQIKGTPMLNSIEDRGLEEVFKQNNNMNIAALIGKAINLIGKKNKTKSDKKKLIKDISKLARKEFGDDFFTKELHLPKALIDLFLEEYCKDPKFIELFQANKKIECIEFLFEKNKLKKYTMK